MNRTLNIAGHEFRQYFLKGRSRSLIAAVLIMVMASIFLNVREYHLLNRQYKENLGQSRLNWDSQTEKDPHDAAHDGTYVVRPPYPLFMVDRGIQPYAGQVVHLRAHQRNQSSLLPAKDHSGLFRFGELTPSFLLLYIVSILLIFLGYDTFTEEKENQTIRLLLSQGVSPVQLALGKWLALFSLMIALYSILFLGVAAGYCFLNGDISIGFFQWLAFAGVYLLYLLSFINLVVMISGIVRSSRISLMALLAIWIAMTLVIPKLSTNLAGNAYPFPTLQTFRDNINRDLQTGLNGHSFYSDSAKEFKEKILKEYGVKAIQELPVAFNGLMLAEGEKYESRIYSKHFNLLKTQYHNQRRVYRFCSAFSPFLSVKFVSMAISRTDYGFQWHFEDEAEKHRVVINTILNMDIAENAKGIEHYKATSDLWATVPDFLYEWQAFDKIFKAHFLEYLIITLWAVASFWGMLTACRKIKVV